MDAELEPDVAGVADNVTVHGGHARLCRLESVDELGDGALNLGARDELLVHKLPVPVGQRVPCVVGGDADVAELLRPARRAGLHPHTFDVLSLVDELTTIAEEALVPGPTGDIGAVVLQRARPRVIDRVSDVARGHPIADDPDVTEVVVEDVSVGDVFDLVLDDEQVSSRSSPKSSERVRTSKYIAWGPDWGLKSYSS